MEGTSFYGVVVKPGRKSVWEPNKERSNKLHLSNATLGANARKGERVRLRCRRADEGKTDIYLCSLLGGSAETSSLDVIFDEYVETPTPDGYTFDDYLKREYEIYTQRTQPSVTRRNFLLMRI